MGSLKDYAKKHEAIDNQDKGERIDFKVIDRLFNWKHNYFNIWVKKIGDTVEVEMCHGINTYVCVYKLVKDNTYSFQYIYRTPAFWLMIDKKTTHLPIYDTYEKEAEQQYKVYVLTYELIALSVRAMKYAKYNVQKAA